VLSKQVRRISGPVVGYLALLSSFGFLGLFVAALAYQAELARILGIALAGSLVLGVLGFRAGSANSRDPGRSASLWSKPRRQTQVDQYYVNFRRGQRGVRRPRSAEFQQRVGAAELLGQIQLPEGREQLSECQAPATRHRQIVHRADPRHGVHQVSQLSL
jgi:hypothetical protein